MLVKFKISFFAPICGLLLVGCTDTAQDPVAIENIKLTKDLRNIIEVQSLTGEPAEGRDLPPVDSPIVTLGMQLFFSQALSGEMDVACVSCHHPVLGGGDELALSIGVEAVEPLLLGPGREHSSAGTEFDGGPTVPRNAPTTFNIGLYDKAIFHDGRIESIEGNTGANGTGTQILTPDSTNRSTPDPKAVNLAAGQVRFPVTSNEEMKGHKKGALNNEGIRDYLVTRLRGDNDDLPINEWLTAFRVGLQDENGTAESLITQANIFNAIGEYERSQVFVDSPWNSFVKGEDDAISLDAKKGAKLFFATSTDGGANCASCHSGDFFTDENYHNIAMPQIGRGKGDGVTGTNDLGRFKVTKQEADKFAFRTPALLNVAVTSPYGHSGAYQSLEAVVRHHLNVESAVTNYALSDNVSQTGIQSNDLMTNTQEALDKLASDRIAGMPDLIEDLNLTDEQVTQLLAFLNTLTDNCVSGAIDASCLNQWVPNDNTPDPDGLRLVAKFQD
jgi:cytochrome c peroxidase